MLHSNEKTVRDLLFKGNFGLERENLRVTADGFLSKTPNPFPGEGHIVRDFSEIQLEINTDISSSPEEAVAELDSYDAQVERTLAALPEPEYVWPFSNPPYIRSEEDIPIAQFEGEEVSKTVYREYLSDRYGRYKMAFSGIHFNYSFADELLEADFALSDFDDFKAYKDELYISLAERCVAYGWIVNAVTAASPLLDPSYVEKGNIGGDLYMGLGTVRCSELGYWNFFAPILDYSSVPAYARSIQAYIDNGLIRQPSELYYPIRLKPRGVYGLEGLLKGEVSHIELRMFDLNPLYPAGINPADVLFGQLLLIWLASTPRQPFDEKDQVQAAANFKNASHYDLRTVKIVVPNGEVYSVAEAALNVLGFMEEFYVGIDADERVMDCLAYQRSKFTDSVNQRYTHIIRNHYSNGFVVKGMELARQRQRARLEAE